jgi:hypothetical protein
MTWVFTLRKSLGYELYQNWAHLAWAHGLQVYPKHLFLSSQYCLPCALWWVKCTSGTTFPKCWASLSMEEGSLFCCVRTYEIHQTRMLQIVFLVSLESSWEGRGCIGLVSWHLDLWCKSSWILNDFFTEN